MTCECDSNGLESPGKESKRKKNHWQTLPIRFSVKKEEEKKEENTLEKANKGVSCEQLEEVTQGKRF